MSGRISAYLRAARAMSPDLLLPKVLRRLGFDTPAVRRAELLADPKAKEPLRHPRLLQLLESQVQAAGAAPLALAGVRVLEIGCGRLGGLSVAATVAGATSYLGVDPGFEPALFGHPRVRRRYLDRALAKTAAAAGDAALDVAALRRRFADRCRFHAGPLDSLEAADPKPDLVLSISCLEHIHGIERSLARLHAAIAPGARQAHLVNFSNHTSKASPFAGLYETAPDAYSQEFGGHINLLRPPDMLAAFTAAGFAARLIPEDVRPDQLPAAMHPWWTERYDRETLAVRTALVLVN